MNEVDDTCVTKRYPWLLRNEIVILAREKRVPEVSILNTISTSFILNIVMQLTNLTVNTFTWEIFISLLDSHEAFEVQFATSRYNISAQIVRPGQIMQV